MDLSARFAALEAGLSEPSIAPIPAAMEDRFAALMADTIPLNDDGNTKIGRPPKGKRALTNAEHQSAHRGRKLVERKRCIAVLDMETDPFNNVTREEIFPFLAVIYSDQFAPIIIWEEDNALFVDRLIREIEGLSDCYTIYAHNGGKFDYMFLVKRLRGKVKFKGRGIMSCRIGNHELRDSFHIIPERLANWKKDDFDYSQLAKGRRGHFRENTIRYCISDCRYLLQIVRKFVDEFGFKLSIGQAALSKLNEHYKVERLGELLDGKLRGVSTDRRDKERYGKSNGQGYFFGGRVACLAGQGHFIGPYKLFDVNSMYPYVMAYVLHPIGNNYSFVEGDAPTENTAFLKLRCNNNGVLVSKTADGETTTGVDHGIFYTTIHEYNTALELGLISDVEILRLINCDKFSSFPRFILPLYERRRETKSRLRDFHQLGITEKSDNSEYDDCKKDDMFGKFLLNNGYGKQCQNPRNYKEHAFTDVEGHPLDVQPGGTDGHGGWGWQAKFKNGSYAIWEKRPYTWNELAGEYVHDSKLRFYNVGCGASITGAARAILMRAIHGASDPIYCDTDSIICRNLSGVTFSDTELGAWKLEKEFEEVIIAGKKLYGAKVKGLPDGHKDRLVIKSKGTEGVTWAELHKMLEGAIIEKALKGPTLTRYDQQFYMRRNIRATARTREKLHGTKSGPTEASLLRVAAD